MKLLFFGDLAVPDKESYQELKQIIYKNNLLKDKVVIGNLEGVLTEEENALVKYKTQLFNINGILDIFDGAKATILTLANNHIKDIENKFVSTVESLKKKNIGYTGASINKVDANKPYEFMIEGKKYAVFSHCWEVYGEIIKNKSNKIHINDQSYNQLIKDVKDYKIRGGVRRCNYYCLLTLEF